MSRQVLNPAIYSAVKRMSFKQMNDYLLDIYQSGMQEEKEKLMLGADEAAIMDLDTFRDIISEVDSLSSEQIEAIVQKMTELMN